MSVLQCGCSGKLQSDDLAGVQVGAGATVWGQQEPHVSAAHDHGERRGAEASHL